MDQLKVIKIGYAGKRMYIRDFFRQSLPEVGLDIESDASTDNIAFDYSLKALEDMIKYIAILIEPDRRIVNVKINEEEYSIVMEVYNGYSSNFFIKPDRDLPSAALRDRTLRPPSP